MSLPLNEQALFDHAKRSLPRWLVKAKNATLEWLYAYAEIFEHVRAQGQDWLDRTYITRATGKDLEQHAKDRGTSRAPGETDASLQTRLATTTDAVTLPAVRAAINALLARASLPTCLIFALRVHRAHYQVPTKSTAFCSRGYRMAFANYPQGYVVLLPFGATPANRLAVIELLRQLGPAGFAAHVEIRPS